MVEVAFGKPFLIGILADVSGSMQNSIGSSGASAMNRLEAFSEALENLVQQAAAFVREGSRNESPIGARLFAYGFGFGNILRVTRAEWTTGPGLTGSRRTRRAHR